MNHKGKTVEEFLNHVNSRIEYERNPSNCKVYLCSDKPFAKGLCNKHYTSFKTTYKNYSLERFIEIKSKKNEVIK